MGTSSFKTCKSRNTDFKRNHVSATQSMLIRKLSTISQTTTNGAGLCIRCYAGYCQSSNQKIFLHVVVK